jgi:hypothetical protein
MEPVSIALGLASVIPSIVKWVSGSDKAAAVAQSVVGMAQQIAGKTDPQDAVKAVLADPALALQLQAQYYAFEVSIYQEETRRLETVNQTIRAEIASGDPFVRRARSSFLWAMSLTWTTEGATIMGLMAYVAIAKPADGVLLIEALTALLGQMSTHWLYAMAVSGVAVWARTADKQTAAQAPGLLGQIAQAFGRRG